MPYLLHHSFFLPEVCRGDCRGDSRRLIAPRQATRLYKLHSYAMLPSKFLWCAVDSTVGGALKSRGSGRDFGEEVGYKNRHEK